MHVRPYKLEDYAHLESWCRQRDIKAPIASMLSTNGVMVEGIAVGFLYATDSSVGILDCYVTNPTITKGIRRRALEVITATLVEMAQSLGIEHLKCDTQIKSIAQLAIDCGFKETGSFRSFIKDL